ncbi:MAG: hypothetical protein NE328_19110 [Lentisphaeraceae bacterium]|nr:hypothetical protein [Lentisphaeraceae bacterium]
MKTYNYRGKEYGIARLSFIPECKVGYRLLYNRINALGWPVDKAVETPKGTTLKTVLKNESSQPMNFSISNKDKEFIEREKLKQIFKRPVKPTSTYVYWVQGNHRGVL